MIFSTAGLSENLISPFAGNSPRSWRRFSQRGLVFPSSQALCTRSFARKRSSAAAFWSVRVSAWSTRAAASSTIISSSRGFFVPDLRAVAVLAGVCPGQRAPLLFVVQGCPEHSDSDAPSRAAKRDSNSKEVLKRGCAIDKAQGTFFSRTLQRVAYWLSTRGRLFKG